MERHPFEAVTRVDPMPMPKDIPVAWIQKYVDTLIEVAEHMPQHGAMHTSTLLRADHAMDLLEAWIKKDEPRGV